jgi:hypothetical protein
MTVQTNTHMTTNLLRIACLPSPTQYKLQNTAASRFNLGASFLVGLLFIVLGISAPARSADYGIFIDVETEEDLLDLLSSDEIDQDTFETLTELLHDGVDLNTASREDLYSLPNLTYVDVDLILAYRQSAGTIVDPTALVAAGVLGAAKLSACAPFLLVSEEQKGGSAIRGLLRYRTTDVAGDHQVPGMWLSANLSPLNRLEFGAIGVLTRNQLSNVVYDPNRDALSANPSSVQFHIPKYFAQWKTKEWHLIAGSYRIGFGKKLTFDNTSQVTPNGIRPDETLYYTQDLSRSCRESPGELGLTPCGENANTYESPDYRWQDRLRGAAAGYQKRDTFGRGMQAFGFFSLQTHSIYQYELYDRNRCADPENDQDPNCAAPYVYRRQPDPLAPTSRFSYSILPDMFNETLLGANATYFFDDRTHVGTTGYGSTISWLVKGMDLDFQEWSRFPYGGPFGAVGIDGAWGKGFLDLYVEIARGFDSEPAGGGFAAIVGAIGTWKKQHFEVSIRSYDKDYANPYSSAVSAPDEYEGLRGRNETGVRLHYGGTFDDLEVHGLTDFWAQNSNRTASILIKGRVDYPVAKWFKPGLWVDYQDKDLTASERGSCFEVSTDTVEGKPVPCPGEKIQIGTQFKFTPFQKLTILTKYQHRFIDDSRDVFRIENRFRQDVLAWLTVIYQPLDKLKLRARVRYLFEDISDNTYLEQSLWTTVEGIWLLGPSSRIKLRYEFYDWLDNRSSTLERQPNPAHWFRVEMDYRF